MIKWHILVIKYGCSYGYFYFLNYLEKFQMNELETYETMFFREMVVKSFHVTIRYEELKIMELIPYYSKCKI